MDIHLYEPFASLPQKIMEKIEPIVRSQHFADGAVLFVEGEKGSSFFIIEEGEVEISRDQVPVGVLKKGDAFGESSLTDRMRTATAKAKGALTAIEIPVAPLGKALSPTEYAVLKNSLLGRAIDKIGNLNKLAAMSIKQNFEDLKTKEYIGQFIVYLLAFIFIYVFVLQAVTAFELNIVSSSVISIPILLIMGFGMYGLMRKSGDSLEAFGLTLKNWKKALVESALYTIPVLVVLTILKWVFIHAIPRFEGLSLFHVSPALKPGEHVTHLEGAILVIAYAFFVPVQEMVFRGAIQSSLEKFLAGKKRTYFAIMISNIPFAMIHFHLSLILVILTYFFGAFWGWMYSREKTLVAPIFSHFVVGLYAFFILGIQDILVI